MNSKSMNVDKQLSLNATNQDHVFSDSDLLNKNTFVDLDSLVVTGDQVENYKNYYLEKQKQNDQTKVLDAITPNNGKEKDNGDIVPLPANKKQIFRKRKLYLDSKDRDTVAYTDASQYTATWGSSFNNVISATLISLEFSNVSKVITTTSNKLYWINKEDINLTVPFPVYTAVITPGSYTFSTLQSTSQNVINVIRRHDSEPNPDGTSPAFHYFIMDINNDTDYVDFTSLITTPAPANPITTTSGSNVVSFQFPNHGFVNNQTIYIIGVRGIIGGLQASTLTGAFTVTVNNPDTFSYSITNFPTSAQTGGGGTVLCGVLAPYQFLFGNYSDTIADILGIRVENSSFDLTGMVDNNNNLIQNPLSCTLLPITNMITGRVTTVVSPNHGLLVGDIIQFNDLITGPSLSQDPRYFGGIISVYAVPSPDAFIIDFPTHSADFSNATIGTRLFSMHFTNHGFNKIVSIDQYAVNQVLITTLYAHGLVSGENVRLNQTNSVPIIDGYYYNIIVISLDSFTVGNPVDPLTPNILPLTITRSGFNGILNANQTFYLYNVVQFGGFTTAQLNSVPFNIRTIIDENNFTFTGSYGFSTSNASGGGLGIRINSLLHGWNGIQTNSPNGVLNKPVKLSGDNYAYLCVGNLPSDTVVTNGPCKNILAKAFIVYNPGIVIFNQFDSATLEFTNPIERLDHLDLTVVSPDNKITTFGGLDYSMGIEFTELVTVDANNYQSWRTSLASQFEYPYF
jgi:hypothetical protein